MGRIGPMSWQTNKSMPKTNFIESILHLHCSKQILFASFAPLRENSFFVLVALCFWVDLYVVHSSKNALLHRCLRRHLTIPKSVRLGAGAVSGYVLEET